MVTLTAVAHVLSLHVPENRATPSKSTSTRMPSSCQWSTSFGSMDQGLSSPLKCRIFARAASGWKKGLNVRLKGPDGATWRSNVDVSRP